MATVLVDSNVLLDVRPCRESLASHLAELGEAAPKPLAVIRR